VIFHSYVSLPEGILKNYDIPQIAAAMAHPSRAAPAKSRSVMASSTPQRVICDGDGQPIPRCWEKTYGKTLNTPYEKPMKSQFLMWVDTC